MATHTQLKLRFAAHLAGEPLEVPPCSKVELEIALEVTEVFAELAVDHAVLPGAYGAAQHQLGPVARDVLAVAAAQGAVPAGEADAAAEVMVPARLEVETAAREVTAQGCAQAGESFVLRPEVHLQAGARSIVRPLQPSEEELSLRLDVAAAAQ